MIKARMAAAKAIATHTANLGIDDDDNSAEIGMWHLLYSAMVYAEEKGIYFDAAMKDVEQEIAARPDPLYLVITWDIPGPATVAMPITAYEMEVRAPSIKAACELVLEGIRPHPDIHWRQTKEPNSNLYIEPDWDRYAAVAAVRQGYPTDGIDGVKHAHSLEFAKVPEVREVEVHYDAENNPVMSAEVSIEAACEVLGSTAETPDAKLRELLRSLATYAEWTAVDMKELTAEAKADREMARPKI